MGNQHPNEVHDLAIGRRLDSHTATVEDVIAIGDLPAARRAPFVGALFALVQDPAMRAAALTALRGARGVPGVRAMVAALGEGDAARVALSVTARDAPMRWVHALFHGDVAVRRAAIPETPQGALELVAYLRADPACADLVGNARWPDAALPLAFDLHAHDRLADAELVRVIASAPSADVRAFFEAERGRLPEDVEAYLDEPTELAGNDVIDQAFAAIVGAGIDGAEDVKHPDHPARWALRAMDTVMEAVVTKRPTPLTRRAAASLLSTI